MVTKIAEVFHVLRQAPEALRKQAAYIEHLESLLESKQRREGAEKLASKMHEKGIDSDIPISRLSDRLEKFAAEDAAAYDKLCGAVDLVGPDMGSKIGSVLNNDDEERSSAGHVLERWITCQLG